jgi:hypothetical protein
LREAVAQRLLLRAQADPARREGYASACLETELAELPRAAAFPTIFNGALVALSPATLDRTLAGLGVLDASEDSEESKRLFARLRAALLIERLEAEGRSLDEAARVVIDLAAPDQAAAVGPLALHLAAAYLRAGDAAGARRLFEATRKVVAAQRESGRELLVGLDFLERAAQGKPTAVTGADRAALLQTAPEALAAGAVEASRALRRPAPSVEALRLLDPEDVGMVIPWRERAALVRDLFKTGAWAAAEARDLGALKSLAELLRRTGLAGGWEIFLRALLADEAARLAAGSQSDEAWGLAVTLARRGPGAFEKAKMSGRIAFEFLRAAQLPPLPLRWVDPHFPSTRPAEAR